MVLHQTYSVTLKITSQAQVLSLSVIHGVVEMLSGGFTSTFRTRTPGWKLRIWTGAVMFLHHEDLVEPFNCTFRGDFKLDGWCVNNIINVLSAQDSTRELVTIRMEHD